MRTFDPHLFWRGAIEPISLGVLGLIVTSIVIGTVAVIRTATFDIRQRARTYPTCPSYCLNDCTEQNDTLVCLAYCTENLIKDCTYGCQETTGGGVCKSAPPANVCTTSQTYRCNGATSEYCAVSGQPPASSTNCEFGCSDENGKCKVAQTCPSQCIKGCYPDNTCQAYCSSEMESECAAKGTTCNATLTGGVCNASPEPVQATGASCYYGDSSCANIGRYSASGCSSSCPVGTGLASCCSDLIPKAPIKVGDSCSQPHGQPVNGTIYCCNGTAQGGQCAGSVAHYLGQSNALPLHTWCEWGFIASCSRCPNGETYSLNNKDYCGKAPPETTTTPVIQPAVTYTNPLESVVSTIIANDPAYYQEQLTQSFQAGQITAQCQGDVVCNYLVTNALANLEADPYLLGQSNLNRFGAAVGLGGPAGAAIGAAGIGIYATGGQILQYGPQIAAAGTTVATFGQQLYQTAQNVYTQLGQSVAVKISTSLQGQRLIAQLETCLANAVCRLTLDLSGLDVAAYPLANAGLRNPYLISGPLQNTPNNPKVVLIDTQVAQEFQNTGQVRLRGVLFTNPGFTPEETLMSQRLAGALTGESGITPVIVNDLESAVATLLRLPPSQRELYIDAHGVVTPTGMYLQMGGRNYTAGALADVLVEAGLPSNCAIGLHVCQAGTQFTPGVPSFGQILSSDLTNAGIRNVSIYAAQGDVIIESVIQSGRTTTEIYVVDMFNDKIQNGFRQIINGTIIN